MSLTLLPDLTFPVARNAIDPLMTNLVQLNTIDAALGENMQRALGLMLHTWDLWVKSGGRIDYRGVGGHERLKQDAETFLCGSPVATRNGDLSAAHLSIDYHDTQVRLKGLGLPPLPSSVNDLLKLCQDLYGLSLQDEKRIGLLLDYLGKKPML